MNFITVSLSMLRVSVCKWYLFMNFVSSKARFSSIHFSSNRYEQMSNSYISCKEQCIYFSFCKPNSLHRVNVAHNAYQTQWYRGGRYYTIQFCLSFQGVTNCTDKGKVEINNLWRNLSYYQTCFHKIRLTYACVSSS